VNNRLKCGAAERIITPPLGLPIPGYFGPRYSTGIKDDLYTQAVVLDDGINVFAIVSIDIMDFKASLAKALRNAVKKEAKRDIKILVAATHAHTASPTNYTCLESPGHMPTVRNIIKLSAEAVLEAYEKRVPVKAGYAQGTEERISFCRNYFLNDGTIRTNPGISGAPMVVKPVSEIDKTVTVLRFDDEKGRTVARVVNFACHPDTVGGNEYCADYIGELRRIIKEKDGKDTVLAFLNGCAGDINHVDGMRYKTEPGYVREADHYKYMGRCLSESLFKAEEDIAFDIAPEISVKSRTFRGERRQPSEADVSWAREVKKLGGNAPKVDRIYAEELIELYEHPKYFTNVEIQTALIGDCTLTALPGEIFSDIGFYIKSRSPYGRNMIAELGNGAHGYLVTEPCFSAGVYEAKLAKHNSFFAPAIAFKMADTAVALLNEIKEENK